MPARPGEPRCLGPSSRRLRSLDSWSWCGLSARSCSVRVRPIGPSPMHRRSAVIVETLPGEGEPVPAEPVVAAGELSGIPVGYPRTDQGATTAAVNWVASFPRLMRMGPLRLSNTLGELMTESAGPAGVAEAVADYWVLFDELGPEFRERVWIESPLQTDVTSTSESVAEVRVWSVRDDRRSGVGSGRVDLADASDHVGVGARRLACRRRHRRRGSNARAGRGVAAVAAERLRGRRFVDAGCVC